MLTLSMIVGLKFFIHCYIENVSTQQNTSINGCVYNDLNCDKCSDLLTHPYSLENTGGLPNVAFIVIWTFGFSE